MHVINVEPGTKDLCPQYQTFNAQGHCLYSASDLIAALTAAIRDGATGLMIRQGTTEISLTVNMLRA